MRTDKVNRSLTLPEICLAPYPWAAGATSTFSLKPKLHVKIDIP